MECQTPNVSELVPTIVGWLADAKVVAYEDWGHYNARYIYQLNDRPHKVTRANLRAAVERCALHYMDARAADPTAHDRKVCERAAAALRAKEAGTYQYFRHLTELVVDELPAVDERPQLAPATKRTRTAEERRTYRARRSAADRERTRTGIEKWLRLLPAGRHDVADLWARWQREVLTTQTARVPEFGRVGRNDWYALLADVTPVHTGGGHRRYVVLHETTPASTIEA